MIRRINLFGGPGSGKSTLAPKIFSKLKCSNYDIELILEYIKTWAHQCKKPISYDQLYIFAKQLKSEDVALRTIQSIVTDSPLLLNAAYSEFYKFSGSSQIVELANLFNQEYRSLNLFIDRTVPYIEKGRYQNYKEAIEFDEFLLNFLNKNLDDDIHFIKIDEFDKIISLIENKLSGELNG